MFNVQGNNSLKNSPSPAIKKKCILYNLNFQHQIFYDKQIQSTPSQPISVRPLVILSTHLCLGLQSHLFLPGFPTKIPYTFLFSPTHSKCLCISFCLIRSPGKYRSWSSSLCHLPESPVIPLLLHPHIYTLCLNIFNQYSSLKVTGQVSQYKTILL